MPTDVDALLAYGYDLKRAVSGIVAVVLALLLGACNADLRGNPVNTDITFTVEAFNGTTLDVVVPMLDVMVSIPGHQPWLIAHNVPTPYRFTIYSAEYPQAARDASITAKLVDVNPDVVLRCAWYAQTPSGTRSSQDSEGGEGESSAGAPVTCTYTA